MATRGFAVPLTLLALFLAANASAAEQVASADLQTSATTSFLGEFNATANSSVGLWRVDGGTFLELRAAHVDVDLYQVAIAGGALLDVNLPQPTSQEHAYDNATLILEGGTDGYLGYQGESAGGSRFFNGSHAEVAPSGPETLRTNQNLTGDQAPDDEPAFMAQVPDPHLQVSGATLLNEGFGGVVKLDGPSMIVDSTQGHEAFATGRHYDTPVSGTHTWAVIRVQQGSLVVSSADPGYAVVPSLVAAWTGELDVPAAHGNVSGSAGVELLDGQDAAISGPGEVRIAPVQSGGATLAQETVRIPAQVQGGGAPVALPPVHVSRLLVAGAALLAIGAVGGAKLYRRLRPRVTLEQCSDMATAARAGGRHAVALEWIERALEIGPETARLRMEQGDCLAALGNVAGALEAYERAAGLTDDGEPLYMAALLADAVDEGPEAVERLLARALERTPLFALALEEDFPRLRSRRSFRAMLVQARGRLG